MEVESEETSEEQVEARLDSCFNEYLPEEITRLDTHDLHVIDSSSQLVIPCKVRKALEQKGLSLGALSLEKIIFSSLFSQVKISTSQKQKVQTFIDQANSNNSGRTRLLFRDQLLKGFINQNGQLFQQVLKF